MVFAVPLGRITDPSVSLRVPELKKKGLVPEPSVKIPAPATENEPDSVKIPPLRTTELAPVKFENSIDPATPFGSLGPLLPNGTAWLLRIAKVWMSAKERAGKRKRETAKTKGAAFK